MAVVTPITKERVEKALGVRRMALLEDLDIQSNGIDTVIDVALEYPYSSQETTIRVLTVEESDTFKILMDDLKNWIDEAEEDPTHPSYAGHTYPPYE